jgi:hypothetical protein
LYGYRLQGLLAASNCALPGLKPLDTMDEPDVVFHAGFLPPGLDVQRLQRNEPVYTSPYRSPGGEPLSRMWQSRESGHYYSRYHGDFAFAVDAGGKTIWAEWADPVTLEDITAYLLGRILAFVLHLRWYACLHASAVVIDGRAVLFAGEPGMGKSSTAAAFAERGYPLLSDDVSAIRREPEGRLVVMSGVPRVCLWPDSLKFLYGTRPAEGILRMHPGEDKWVVPLDNSPAKIRSEPAPLGAIYLLAAREASPNAPRTEPVAGSDRLIRLLSNGFMSLSLRGRQKEHEFRLLGEIARTIRIQQLVPSTDPKKLDRLCALVSEEVRQAEGAAGDFRGSTERRTREPACIPSAGGGPSERILPD